MKVAKNDNFLSKKSNKRIVEMTFKKLWSITWSKITGSSLSPKESDLQGEAEKRKSGNCRNCGQQFEKNWMVCPYCGMKIITEENMNQKEDRSIRSDTSILHAPEKKAKDQGQDKEHHQGKEQPVHPEPTKEIQLQKWQVTHIPDKDTKVNDLGQKKRYHLDRNLPNDFQLPQKLVTYLPDADTIEIMSYGNEETSYGTRLNMRAFRFPAGKPFIKYRPLIYVEQKMEVKRNCAYRVFENSYHPFLRQYTKDIVTCSKNMLNGHPVGEYRPSSFGIAEDTLLVDMDGGYHITGYKETPNYIGYMDRYQDSIHDGGDSGSTELYLYAAPGKEPTQELSHDRYLGWCILPECKGYWVEKKHLYLVEPWGLSGVFAYFYSTTVRSGGSTDVTVREIGVKNLGD